MDVLYPLVISNAKIVDGCGNPWYWGDLALEILDKLQLHYGEGGK